MILKTEGPCWGVFQRGGGVFDFEEGVWVCVAVCWGVFTRGGGVLELGAVIETPDFGAKTAVLVTLGQFCWNGGGAITPSARAWGGVFDSGTGFRAMQGVQAWLVGCWSWEMGPDHASLYIGGFLSVKEGCLVLSGVQEGGRPPSLLEESASK